MRRVLFALLAISSLFAPAAYALNIGDTTVILPIIGRFPGAGGTQWRTDVFIANHSTVAKNVTLVFYVAGGTPLTRSVPMGAFSVATLPDITLNTFGLSNASGQLQLRSDSQSGFEARARIYNAGNAAGEFGQNVPGLGDAYLNRQGFLFGLSGLSGNRVNIGVANPSNDPIAVSLFISDKNNNPLASDAFTVQAHQTIQVNLFDRYGITPQADVQVNYTSEARFYAYASEVRNDTGDAVFIFGTSPNS